MDEYDDFDDSLDSPTDSDEYVMNEDDCAPEDDGPLDGNEEYERDDGYDGQPDEAQEWHDFDPDC